MRREMRMNHNFKANHRPFKKKPRRSRVFCIVVQRDGRLTPGLLDQSIATLDLGVSESDQLATDIDHQGT